MASDSFIFNDIKILDPNAPSTIEVWAVDRSILNDLHVDFILSQLPQTEARIDAPSYRPYVGIDLFYGGDATVKGLVFATQARALVVRLPDNAATTSATLYERNKAKAASDGARKKSKGKSILPDPHRLTPYDRLRKLLEADLAGFGMAQISLTLWDTLRERVGGVNLSSAPFQPLQPATHKIPDPTPRTDANSTGEPTLQDRRARDGRNKRGSNGSVSGRERREQQHTKSKKPKSIAVHLPEDEKENWDRPIKSPGEVLKLIYESISQLDINSVFIGQPELIDMKTRVEEAVIRAWLSYIAGDKLNSVIQDAPVVKPSRLTDEELHFFSKSMVAAWKVMGERGAGRVIELNEIEDPGVSNKLESKFHKSKIRPGKNQFATFTMSDGVEKPLYMSRAAGNFKQITFREKEEDEKDRKGHDMTNGAESKMDKRQTNAIEDTALGLPTPPEDALFSLEEVQHISVYGREDTTMWEERRDAFILRLLEGRGALHGPGYDDDCEFIRRVWFPTPAQIETGRLRKEKNDPPPGPQRHDWMDDSWGDDTSEDEALRRNNTRAPNLVDYDTEEEDVGHDIHINEMPAQLEGQVNPSQLKVIGRITAPLPGKRVRATLVHGPPGTGKTRTIAGAVIRLVNAGEPVWVAAQSNVGIRNVADKLVEVKFEDFILVVSEEYRVWWQNRYSELQRFVISSKSLAMPGKKLIERIRSAKMVLCTLASLSNPQVEKQIMPCVPLRHLIIDEASQIDMTSEFMHVFFRYRYCLKSVCWFGDPMQLPPYGWSEDRKIDDIFKVEHLQANSKLLDTSYRLPIPITSFISRDVYSGKLQAWPNHPIKDPIHAVRFIDVSEGEEKKQDHGTSFMNHAEADVVVKIAQLYYHNVAGTDENGDPRLYDYEIITPYEAQRLLVVDKLKEVGITKEVYSADSFQVSNISSDCVSELIAANTGNEADYIITTLTRTNMTSFMKSINRLNVILTRCKRGLVIVTRKDFVLAAGGLLQGLSYSMEKDNIWATAEDASNGCVDLPGVEAPNEYASSEEDE